jgi:hypothetical protein
MDVNSLKYYIEHQSTNPIPEERVKENKELRNYLISKSMFDCEWKSEKIEQIIGRALRIDENTNNQPILTAKNESVAIPTNNSTENNKK